MDYTTIVLYLTKFYIFSALHQSSSTKYPPHMCPLSVILYIQLTIVITCLADSLCKNKNNKEFAFAMFSFLFTAVCG
jgi:hypothetical protein